MVMIRQDLASFLETLNKYYDMTYTVNGRVESPKQAARLISAQITEPQTVELLALMERASPDTVLNYLSNNFGLKQARA
jgi:hypothetical protein